MFDRVPEASLKLQRIPAYYAFTKAANTIGYFVLLYLTWRFCTHQLDWQLGTSCVIISGGWLVLTRIKLDHLLQTYTDFLSRIETTLPVVLGCLLSAVAVIAPGGPTYHYAAGGEILGWLYIFALYMANRSKFKKQGYGPIPKDAMVDPPVSVMRAGDLLLTSGNIAKELHDSVGHAETVIKMPDGRTMLFSSYMDKGCRLHPVEDLTVHDDNRHYVGLHLAKPWNEEEQQKAAQIAAEMEATNRKWAAEENARVAKRIDWLPLPAKAKDILRKLFHTEGYDWFGMFMGRVADNRWTCIGAALELYQRMGVKTNYYGTGLLGFGTTLFDPILPVRFLSDDAFKLITQEEQPAAEHQSV
jgi:prepilin signal peptidase PulO-like enzyme (type II secretory pathway)